MKYSKKEIKAQNAKILSLTNDISALSIRKIYKLHEDNPQELKLKIAQLKKELNYYLKFIKDENKNKT